jgi:hypothetical protein
MPISRRALAQADSIPVADRGQGLRSALPLPAVKAVKPAEPIKAKGIFDKYVAEIVADARYLTADNIMALKRALPFEDIPKLEGKGVDLSGLLETLTKLHHRMQVVGLSSDDPAEIKNMIASTKTVIDLVNKYQEGISQQSRQALLESATVEAFAELGNEVLRATFMRIFKEKLGQSGPKSASKLSNRAHKSPDI